MGQSFESWYVQHRAEHEAVILDPDRTRRRAEILDALRALRDELHGLNEDIAKRREEAAGRIGGHEAHKDAGTTSGAPTEAPGPVCGEAAR